MNIRTIIIALCAALLLVPASGLFSSSSTAVQVRADGASDITIGGPYSGASGDRMGGLVLSADITGDDIPDLIVSAPGNSRVYIFKGPVSSTTDLSASMADITISGEDSTGFSTALAICDYDGDTFPDLAVSAPYADNSSGAIYIFRGPISASTTYASAYTTILCNGSGSRMGASMKALGGFDDDIGEDLIVGIPGWNGSALMGGAVFILPGGWSGLHYITDSNVYFLGTTDNEMVGSSVYSLGDINGDGYDDGGFLRGSGNVDVIFGRHTSQSNRSAPQTRSYNYEKLSTFIDTNLTSVSGADKQCAPDPVTESPTSEPNSTPAAARGRGHAGTTDLTTGRGSYCTVSHSYDNDPATWGGQKAVDDDSGSYWNSGETSSAEWWKVDLGSIYDIAKVTVYTDHPSAILTGHVHLTEWSIYGSIDGSTYSLLYHKSGNTVDGWVDCTFTKTPARYIKITNIHFNTYIDPSYGTFDDSNLYRILAEVRVYDWVNYAPTNEGSTVSGPEIYARDGTFEITTSFSDQDGASDISITDLLVNSDQTPIGDSSPGFLHAVYYPASNRFGIYDNDNNGVTSTVVAGGGDLENDYAILHCGPSESYASMDGNTLTVHWVMEFKFTWGNELCYPYQSCEDSDGESTMYQIGSPFTVYSELGIDNENGIGIVSPVIGHLNSTSWLSPTTPVYIYSDGANVVYAGSNHVVDDKYYTAKITADTDSWVDDSTDDTNGSFNVTVYGRQTNDPTGTDYVLTICDSDGGTSEGITVGTFRTDAKGPSINITDISDPIWDPDGNELNNEGNWYNSQSIQAGFHMNISVSDGESGFSTAWILWDAPGNTSDGNFSADSHSITITPPAVVDGQVNISVRAFDMAGNYADSSITINVDNTPPTAVSDFVIHPQQGVNGDMDDDGEVYLTWNNSWDSGSGVKGYMIGINDPDPETYVTSENTTTLQLPSGMMDYVYIRAVDMVGNLGPVTFDTIYVNFKAEATLMNLPSDPVITPAGDIDGDGADDVFISSRSGGSDVVVLFGQTDMSGDINIQIASTMVFSKGPSIAAYGNSVASRPWGETTFISITFNDGTNTGVKLFLLSGSDIGSGKSYSPQQADESINITGTEAGASTTIISQEGSDPKVVLVVGEPYYGSGGTVETITYKVNPDINNHPPVLYLLSPRGGEKWTGSRDITWTASDPDGDSLKFTIKLSWDGGTSYNTTIASGLSGSTRAYKFNTEPYPNGTTYRIKITANDGHTLNSESSVESPDNFQIYHPGQGENHPPVINILYPNGGEVLDGVVGLIWTASDPDGDNLSFDIYLSPDGGMSWPFLVATVGNERDFDLDTSEYPNGSTYMLKITADDGKTDGKTSDVTDSVFTIQHAGQASDDNNRPTIHLISPHGGETYSSTVDILWEASDPDGDDLTISIFYRDFDSSWINIVSNVPNTGNFTWDVSDMPSKNTYKVKVVASDGKLTDWDSSDSVFSIVKNRPPETVIQTPMQGSEWYVGENITFNALGSSDPDGDKLIYTWYANGDVFYKGSEISIVHSFSEAGDKSIKLVVMDPFGQSSSKTIDITVIKRPVGKVSVSNLAISIDNGTVDLKVGIICVGGEASNITLKITAEYTDGSTYLVGQQVLDMPFNSSRNISQTWQAVKGGQVAFKAEIVDTNPMNDRLSNYYDITLPHERAGNQTGSAESGSSSALLWIIILVIVVLAALVIALLIKRQRESHEIEDDEIEDALTAVPSRSKMASTEGLDDMLDLDQIYDSGKSHKDNKKKSNAKKDKKKGAKGKGKKKGDNKPHPSKVATPSNTFTEDLDSIDFDISDWGDSIGGDGKKD